MVRVVACVSVALASVMPTAGCAKRDPSVALATPVGSAGGSALRVTLALEGRVGSPSGHIQIPKGGQPGTTTLGRPTFEELGVDAAWAPAGDLRLDWGKNRVHLGGAWWMLQGEGTLRQALTTHADAYPAGTLLTSSSSILSSWLAYDRTFDVGGDVELSPGVGIFGHRLSYEVSGAGTSSTRDFDSFSPLLEMGALWRTGGRMHVTADLRLVLDDLFGLSSPTTLIEGDVRWHWDVSRTSHLYVVVGATHLTHHDEQPVPNDIELDVVPWFGLGGELRF